MWLCIDFFFNQEKRHQFILFIPDLKHYKSILLLCKHFLPAGGNVNTTCPLTSVFGWCLSPSHWSWMFVKIPFKICNIMVVAVPKFASWSLFWVLNCSWTCQVFLFGRLKMSRGGKTHCLLYIEKVVGICIVLVLEGIAHNLCWL